MAVPRSIARSRWRTYYYLADGERVGIQTAIGSRSSGRTIAYGGLGK